MGHSHSQMSNKSPKAAVIMAAGKGTRMRSSRSKSIA